MLFSLIWWNSTSRWRHVSFSLRLKYRTPFYSRFLWSRYPYFNMLPLYNTKFGAFREIIISRKTSGGRLSWIPGVSRPFREGWQPYVSRAVSFLSCLAAGEQRFKLSKRWAAFTSCIDGVEEMKDKSASRQQCVRLSNLAGEIGLSREFCPLSELQQPSFPCALCILFGCGACAHMKGWVSGWWLVVGGWLESRDPITIELGGRGLSD